LIIKKILLVDDQPEVQKLVIGDVRKVDVYLTKPFEMDELLENVKSY